MDSKIINPRAFDVVEVLIKNAMPYSIYTIQSRALPDYRDGLKPSHRRSLVTLEDSGVRHDKARIKSLNAEGRTLALHPHGSVYPTMARLARPDSLNIPLLDAKGSMGYHNSKDLNESAPRYTEVRLAPIAQEFFRNIKKGIVNMKENYDNSRLEPEYLPVTYPSILTNATLGVAVGFASKICPYPFNDVCINTAKVMRGEAPDAMIPDFPSGGYVVEDMETFNKIHSTGVGTVRQRGKYTIEGNKIVFIELPYESTVEEIEAKIIELVKNKTLDKEISDVNNYTDKNGIDLTIEVKKNVNIDLLLEKLFALTNLENSFGCNFTMLYEGRPKKMSVHEFMIKWCNFRVDVARKTLQYDLKKINEELHLLYGLRIVVDETDKVVKTIRESSSDEEAIKNLIDTFGLTETQANYIAERKIRSLNKGTIQEQIEKIFNLEKRAMSFTDMLENEHKIREVLAKQLEELPVKYPYTRKSQVIQVNKTKTKILKEVEDYNVQFVTTAEGYFKKIKMTSLRGNSEHRLKDGDRIVSERNSNNRADLLVFTTKQICYKLKADNIKDHKASELGLYLPSHLQLEEGEVIVDVIPTVDYSEEMLVAFDTGRVVRTPLKSYETKMNRTKLLNALHTDKVVRMFVLTEESNYVLKSADNRALILNSKDITAKISRNSQGIIVMQHKNIEVIDFKHIDEVEVATIGRYSKGKAGVGILLGDNI